jgi:hypothetical protein
MACETHAPVFWKSEPPLTFAHIPLPKSSSATLSPSISFILKLHVGLTIPMYPKCSWPRVHRFNERSLNNGFSTLMTVELRAPVELHWNTPYRRIRRLPKPLPFFRLCQPIFHFSLSNGSPLATHNFQCSELALRIHGNGPQQFTQSSSLSMKPMLRHSLRVAHGLIPNFVARNLRLRRPHEIDVTFRVSIAVVRPPNGEPVLGGHWQVKFSSKCGTWGNP